MAAKLGSMGFVVVLLFSEKLNSQEEPPLSFHGARKSPEFGMLFALKLNRLPPAQSEEEGDDRQHSSGRRGQDREDVDARMQIKSEDREVACL